MMDLELEGRVAIVTGASRGLGRAAAAALVEQGVRVVAAARSIDELNTLKATAPDRIHAIQCDMLDTVAVAGLPQVAIDTFGGLDIVVNNAGIAPAGKFLEQDPAIWDKVIAINVTAPAILTRAAGKHMAAQGSGKSSISLRLREFWAKRCWWPIRHQKEHCCNSPSRWQRNGQRAVSR